LWRSEVTAARERAARRRCSLGGIVRSRSLVRIAVVCLVPAAVACGRLANLKRCQALAEQVNPSLDEIEKRTKRRSPAAYASASRAYAKLAGDLRRHVPDAGADAGRPLVHEAFERSVEEYRSVMEAASRHTAGLAEALDAGNSESAALESRQLEEVTRQAKAAAKRVETSCRPES
jgi:hypothetical protein